MNRQKKAAPRIRTSTYLALIGTAMIVAGGGVTHAILKNCQVNVIREIDAVEKRTEKCLLDIRTTEMRSDHLLTPLAIRKQLRDSGSPLVQIPVGVSEEVTIAPPAAVASVTP